MDQIKTGEIIRAMRLQKNMTQIALAEKLGVSDKAVSKWERGCGAPDVSILPLLAAELGIDMENLLNGNMEENELINGNMRKLKFYVCTDCGNIIFSAADASVSCCGKKLAALEAKKASDDEKLSVEPVENELYVTSTHEMTRENYISFAALLRDDTVTLRKFYPEWNMETRFPGGPMGLLVWYSTSGGLFYQYI
ncbi:MAG: helix-turn-helix domain-containing protein [Oscillospiraceae bacterium]